MDSNVIWHLRQMLAPWWQSETSQLDLLDPDVRDPGLDFDTSTDGVLAVVEVVEGHTQAHVRLQVRNSKANRRRIAN